MKTLFIVMSAASAAFSSCAEARPDLVAQVRSSSRKEARASWWGFDPSDSTDQLQAALTSGVERLIVDRMPTPWIVRPLKGASNLELVLDPGAEIQAKPGEFRSKTASLLTFVRCENIRIVGYGAALRMRHADYMQPPYEKSEWRHALSILSCSNVRVEGITLADSGGDGIYLGNRGGLQRNLNVTIRDVVCERNHRQGISVISAENLLIENTVMRDTFGTPPAAGIDFEPNLPGETLKNCVMRNCRTFNNQGSGYTTWAGQLNSSSEPIDLRFENCTANGDRCAFYFSADTRRGRPVQASLALSNCSFENPKGPLPVNIRETLHSTLSTDIDNCRIVTTNSAGEKTTTPMDGAWAKQHLPLSTDGKPHVPHVPAPNLANACVRDSAPGTSVRLSPLRARNSATYIVYADSARELRFKGHQTRVGRYKPGSKPLVVTDCHGRTISKIPIPGYKETDFSFNAPAPGFYRIDVMVGNGAFLLAEADAAVAIDATSHHQGLISSAGAFWFDVPPKTMRFALYASGEGSERVHVRLYDPEGKCTWDRDNISGWNRIVTDVNPPPGLWKVTTSKPSQGAFEDARFDLAGIPGFLFLSPLKTWTCKP